MTLRRSHLAPAPRTLVDIFRETVALAPDEPALDNGASVLTCSEFHEASELVTGELSELGIGRGDRVGIRLRSGTTDLYVAIMGVLMAGAAYVPVDADDPDERARHRLLRSGRRRDDHRRPHHRPDRAGGPGAGRGRGA